MTATRFAIASFSYNGSEIAGISRFDVAGHTTRLDQSRVVETLGREVENPIYAPLIVKYGGYSLGDPITLQLGAEERDLPHRRVRGEPRAGVHDHGGPRLRGTRQ